MNESKNEVKLNGSLSSLNSYMKVLKSRLQQ
jgi:hypothetical protein